MILLLLACSSDTPSWAVNHLSLIPSSRGIDGTQTWEFFDSAWGHNRSEKHFLCARAQTIEGSVAALPSNCPGCVAAYDLLATDLETDCDNEMGTENGFTATLHIAIGDPPEDLADLDPHPGDSMGWYLASGKDELQPWGFVYEEVLDYDGTQGLPGWVTQQIYTFWPAVALDISQ